MRIIKSELPKELEQIELHVFADLHLGDPECDMPLIKKRLEYVKNTENAYALINGDILNNATITSVSDMYSSRLTPMQEISQAVELFSPLKDKIIAITPGNHERRTYKKEGIDLMEIVAKEMGLYDRYSPASALVFIRFGWNEKQRKTAFTIYMNHGSGGGRTAGAKVNRVAEMANVVDADIYIHAHTHLPFSFRLPIFRVNMQNSSVASLERLFVNTAATLDFGGYGEIAEFRPSSKHNPVIHLNGVRKDMWATV